MLTPVKSTGGAEAYHPQRRLLLDPRPSPHSLCLSSTFFLAEAPAPAIYIYIYTYIGDDIVETRRE